MIGQKTGFANLVCRYGGFVTEGPFYELTWRISV